MSRGGAPGVSLVTMPWEMLERPSIQLGIVQAVLERAGFEVEVHSLKLAFVEHCLLATADRPPSERIGLSNYKRVVERFDVGLGDWIFAVPPFHDTAAKDGEYLAYLRRAGAAEAEVAAARAMKALVPSFLERCADELLAAAPSVVGFTSGANQNVPSLVLAKLLKQRVPSLKILFGGSNCDGPMGAALHRAFPWIDVVVRGEAEAVLADVVGDLVANRPVRPRPGLCYREGERPVAVAQAPGATVAMDDVPTPIYDEYFERLERASFRAEILPDVVLPYETARGCWWGARSHCTFCGLNGTSMAFRSKSPERVLDELPALAARYRRLDIQVVDNILDLGYVRDVLPRLRDAGHDFSVFYETKANLRKDQVQRFREAGVEWIQPGIESLSTPILRLMRKGVTALQNVRLLKWCAEYGVRVRWNVMYGLPREPMKEYERMAETMHSLTHLEAPSLVRLGLDRFSPFHARPDEFGLEIVGPLPYYGMIYPADLATLTDLAYGFDYRHADGRDPDSYVGPLRATIEHWRAHRGRGYRSLRYRRGPGFLVIDDRRPNLEGATYTFGATEAAIYLACDDGASAEEAWTAVGADGDHDADLEEVKEFLDELVERRLVYREDGRYLSLALPMRLPEAAF
jgi:ribosomal peptide maturation radical SAM protein 1